MLFGIDWTLENVLASVIGIDSTTTVFSVVYDTKHYYDYHILRRRI